MDNSYENEDGNSQLNEKTTSSISFPGSSSNYHNSDEHGNHYHNDLQPTCLDSGDVTVVEGYNGPDSAAVGVVSSATRRASTGQAHNIPYMQLFHHLKQKFPDLKDCDINESIQKFGLDRGRCEAELQQRAVAHTSGYYGPWGRTVGNWSTRSSPAPTPSRSDTPFTISHTTPSTPVISPITSPFASQVPMVSPPSHNSRSAPVLIGPPSLVGPPLEVNICPASMAETNCVVTTANSQYGLLISSSSSSPCRMMTSSGQSVGPLSCSSRVNAICLGHSHLVSIPSETIHTATTKHYVASHSITPSLNDIVYRQHSTSTDTTITEEESFVGSNLTSPTSTLPLSPSPQPQGRSHSPTFSPQSREQQLQYPGQFFVPPLQQLPPGSRTVPLSQYHQSQEPFVYQTSPHLYGWNPPLGSVPQNYPFVDRPVNELNHSDYSNSNHIENLLVGPGRTPITQNSYSSVVPLGRQEFIPNISSSPATYTTNISRRSRSTTPGVMFSPPTSAPVVSSSYEPFGSSYLYQHGEARRRCNEHAPLEPVRVAPPPPSAPSARETNYFPGDSSLNDKLSNLHLNPRLLGGTPSVPTMTTTGAVTSRSSPAVPGSRPSEGADREALSAGAAHSSGGVPSTAAGLVAEQRARQQRLRSVLQEGVAEYQSLKQEVNRLEDTLTLRRQQGERAGLVNAQCIEAMQEENRRLQSECDQMEGDILQTGEEPEVLDEEYRPPLSLPGEREAGISSPAALSPFSPAHSRLPPARADPSGDGRSGYEAPRRLTPTRTAPPPPVGGAAAHNLPGSISYEQDEGRGPGGSEGGVDEGGGARWSCNRCTYDNHPAMSSCEICGAIRMPGPSPLQQPPRSGGGSGGGHSSAAASHQQPQAPLGPPMQDIHIRVRHRHDYQGSTPTRGGAHDWAVA